MVTEKHYVLDNNVLPFHQILSMPIVAARNVVFAAGLSWTREDSRGKRSAEGDNIAIDPRYDNNCWFFETTRCQWETPCLSDPFLLTFYNGDANLPKSGPLEEYN
uniref:Uncharacterized protein n=1 Tax=Romanomermis culicivorax TaxID=13658 RepID=A0A915J7R6_ROMCU